LLQKGEKPDFFNEAFENLNLNFLSPFFIYLKRDTVVFKTFSSSFFSSFFFRFRFFIFILKSLCDYFIGPYLSFFNLDRFSFLLVHL